MNKIIFSCIIPASAKDSESKNLKDLIASIKAQDFPQDKIEILVITEGDSEQAKAIGIRRARGEICAMFCADNMIIDNLLFKTVKKTFDLGFKKHSGTYTRYYYYNKNDNSLNRYFSLLGVNDPITYYLNKSDRKSYLQLKKYPIVSLGYPDEFHSEMYFEPGIGINDGIMPSFGDNGFFWKKDVLLKSDLEHYYPMDNALDIIKLGYQVFFVIEGNCIWHKTSYNLFTFLLKRYRYARDLYSERSNRRWRMIDTKEDYIRLALFIFYTLTLIQPLFVSLRGFKKIRDLAWFLHWPVCVGFLITYGVLTLRTFFVRLLSHRWKAALHPCEPL